MTLAQMGHPPTKKQVRSKEARAGADPNGPPALSSARTARAQSMQHGWLDQRIDRRSSRSPWGVNFRRVIRPDVLVGSSPPSPPWRVERAYLSRLGLLLPSERAAFLAY